MMTGQSNIPGSGTDEDRALHMEKRRMEAEKFIVESDRSRFARAEAAMEAEIRMTEKAIEAKERELEEKKTERLRLAQKVQEMDNELMRLKRASYKNH